MGRDEVYVGFKREAKAGVSHLDPFVTNVPMTRQSYLCWDSRWTVDGCQITRGERS
jgi:hypothetical protein